MDALNYLKVSEIKSHLPAFIPTKGKPDAAKIPVMSSKSKEIFIKIRQSIPDTTDWFCSTKTLDESAKQITAKVKEIAEIKKHDKCNKIASALGTVSAGMLVTAAIVATVCTALLLTGPGAVLAPMLIGLIGIPLALALLSLSILGNFDVFSKLPMAKKQLSSLENEANVNHEKLQEYFTVNYKDIKKEIEASIEKKNHDLKIMLKLKEDHSAVKKQLTDEVADLEQALVQLKNLHHFYNQSKKTPKSTSKKGYLKV